MAATVVFDMTSASGGTFHVFETGSGELRTYDDFTITDDGSFHAVSLPEDIRESYLSVPLTLLDFRLLELPLDNPDRIREILPFELEGIVLGGTENVVADAAVIGKAGEKSLVLASYMPRKRLQRLLEGMKALDMDPRSVTSLELTHVLDAWEGDRERLGKMLLVSPSLERRERSPLALETARQPALEFRRGEFACTQDVKRTRKAMNFAFMALAILILVIAADITLRTKQAQREAAALEQQIFQAYTRMFPGEKPSGMSGITYKLKARMKEVREKNEDLRGVDLLDFMMKLRDTVSGDVQFREITLDRQYVSLKGEAPSLSAVEDARRKLEEILSEVKLTESGQAASGQYAFSISAKEKVQQ